MIKGMRMREHIAADLLRAFYRPKPQDRVNEWSIRAGFFAAGFIVALVLARMFMGA